MKKNEILQEINRLKGEIHKLEEAVNKPREEIIYVPKGIISDEFYNGIINHKHNLCHDGEGWNAISFSNGPSSTEKQFKLVPCTRNELIDGDLAFVYMSKGRVDFNKEIRKIVNYCVVIKDAIVFWVSENGGVILVDYELNSEHIWYKVVKA